MTELQKRIYELVRSIPKGEVRTYRQIAEALGNRFLCRFVGTTLHQNPDPETIFCHRVVHQDGSLSEHYAFGGLEGQKKRLEAEGVLIRNKKVIFK